MSSPTEGPTAQLLSTGRDLAVFAERAARHDPATPLRLLASGESLAAFVITPFGCLGLRVTGLREPAEFDVVVEAVGLAARARGAADGTLVLPPRLPDMMWTAPLPPRSGWAVVGTAPPSEAAARLRADTEEFKRRASQVQPGRGAKADIEGVAAELWARSWLGDAPARLVHAAEYLGFLGTAGDAGDAAAGAVSTARRAGPWRRLDTALGVTAVRITDPLGLFVS